MSNRNYSGRCSEVLPEDIPEPYRRGEGETMEYPAHAPGDEVPLIDPFAPWRMESGSMVYGCWEALSDPLSWSSHEEPPAWRGCWGAP